VQPAGCCAGTVEGTLLLLPQTNTKQDLTFKIYFSKMIFFLKTLPLAFLHAPRLCLACSKHNGRPEFLDKHADILPKLAEEIAQTSLHALTVPTARKGIAVDTTWLFFLRRPPVWDESWSNMP